MKKLLLAIVLISSIFLISCADDDLKENQARPIKLSDREKQLLDASDAAQFGLLEFKLSNDVKAYDLFIMSLDKDGTWKKDSQGMTEVIDKYSGIVSIEDIDLKAKSFKLVQTIYNETDKVKRNTPLTIGGEWDIANVKMIKDTKKLILNEDNLLMIISFGHLNLHGFEMEEEFKKPDIIKKNGETYAIYLNPKTEKLNNN